MKTTLLLSILVFLMVMPLTALSQSVSEACKDSFSFQNERERCEKAAVSSYVVETCKTAFRKFDPDFMNPRLACVEYTDNEAELEDCLKSHQKSNNILRCLKGYNSQQVASFCYKNFKKRFSIRCMKTVTTAQVGESCLKVFSRRGNQFKCMRSTFEEEIVKACAQVPVLKRAGNKLACLKEAPSVERIKECKHHQYANRFLACLNNSINIMEDIL